jgi:hypothetical protein
MVTEKKGIDFNLYFVLDVCETQNVCESIEENECVVKDVEECTDVHSNSQS